MSHTVSSIAQLFSFSHAQCNAILQDRYIEIVNAYYPYKTTVLEREAYLTGSIVVLLWGSAVCWLTIIKWSRARRAERLFFAAFSLMGGLLAVLQAKAVAGYSDACRALLAHEAVGKTYQTGSTIISDLIIAVFLIAFLSAFFLAITDAFWRIRR